MQESTYGTKLFLPNSNVSPKPQSNAGILFFRVTDSPQLLLQDHHAHRPAPVWSFLGGIYDPTKDSSAYDTAQREFREEIAPAWLSHAAWGRVHEALRSAPFFWFPYGKYILFVLPDTAGALADLPQRFAALSSEKRGNSETRALGWVSVDMVLSGVARTCALLERALGDSEFRAALRALRQTPMPELRLPQEQQQSELGRDHHRSEWGGAQRKDWGRVHARQQHHQYHHWQPNLRTQGDHVSNYSAAASPPFVSCGTSQSTENYFCASCSEPLYPAVPLPLPPPPPPSTPVVVVTRCATCGHVPPVGNRFCDSCGNALK